MESEFRALSEYPSREDATGIIMRLLDGIGYRFYWSTEGLTPDDYDFSPGRECFTIDELVKHVRGLIQWVHATVGADDIAQRPGAAPLQREHALELLSSLRSHLEKMPLERLREITIKGQPFWHLINGPLSDALTHVGQITSFRRLNGNPVPTHRVFSGE